MTKFILAFAFLCTLFALFYYPVPIDKVENYLENEVEFPPDDTLLHPQQQPTMASKTGQKKNKKKISGFLNNPFISHFHHKDFIIK